MNVALTGREEAETFKRHSKTFSMAAAYLGRRHFRAIAGLYCFFREVDDLCDSADSATREQRLARFEQVNRILKNPYESRSMRAPYFVERLLDLQREFKLAHTPILHFLDTSALDFFPVDLKTDQEVAGYSKGVASTVGLLFCGVVCPASPRALEHASSLGEAMQLTNIARDVYEDYQNQKIFVPGLKREHFVEENVEVIASLRQDMIQKSEVLYRRGLEGLAYLPLRVRFVVFLAAVFYREIGRKILNDPRLYRRRTIVSGWQKLVALLKALPDFFRYGFRPRSAS